MIFVLITHDERFMSYGKKTYFVNDGKLMELENEE